MAKKKAAKSKSKPKAPSHAKVFLANSEAAPPDQAKRREALECIAAAFDSIGVPHVDDPSDRIDWGSFPEDDCNDLAATIEDCLGEKGWDVPPLAANFQFLREDGRVMTVASLIDALIQISD